MPDNQSLEQKSILIIRAPLSEDGFASIYFSTADGRLMNEREWWNLKQIIEVASQVFVKAEVKVHSAAAGA